MPDPIEAILGDSVALALIKGQVERVWKGIQVEGLIDAQDVGTLVEGTMILVSKFYVRVLAKSDQAH